MDPGLACEEGKECGNFVAFSGGGRRSEERLNRAPLSPDPSRTRLLVGDGPAQSPESTVACCFEKRAKTKEARGQRLAFLGLYLMTCAKCLLLTHEHLVMWNGVEMRDEVSDECSKENRRNVLHFCYSGRWKGCRRWLPHFGRLGFVIRLAGCQGLARRSRWRRPHCNWRGCSEATSCGSKERTQNHEGQATGNLLHQGASLPRLPECDHPRSPSLAAEPRQCASGPGA